MEFHFGKKDREDREYIKEIYEQIQNNQQVINQGKQAEQRIDELKQKVVQLENNVEQMGRCILVLVFIRVREDREIEREDGEDDKRGVIDRE